MREASKGKQPTGNITNSKFGTCEAIVCLSNFLLLRCGPVITVLVTLVHRLERMPSLMGVLPNLEHLDPSPHLGLLSFRSEVFLAYHFVARR